MGLKYKIKRVSVKNFKGFNNEKFHDFPINVSSGLTILSGPNGFGKTTFFDVIELFFRKDITRLDKEIEGQQHSKSNIFLNDKNSNAYLLLALENAEKVISEYLLVISNDVVNLKANLDNVVIYKCLEVFDRNKIDEYFPNNYAGSLQIVNSFEEEIGYDKDIFNVYYYVSQAESVHFLKNKMADREETMNMLLGIERIADLNGKISDKVLGKRSDSQAWIRQQISQNMKEQEKLVTEIKQYNKSQTIKKQDYTAVFSDKMREQISTLKWDEEYFDVTKFSEASVIGFINRLFIASLNYEDYTKFIDNEKICEIIQNDSNTLENYLLCKKLISNNDLSTFTVTNEIKSLSNLILINMHSKSLLSYIKNKDERIFDEEFFGKLFKTIEDLDDKMSVDTDLNTLLMDIKNLRNGLGAFKEKLLNLTNIRKNLVDRLDDYALLDAINKNQCPLCRHTFETELFLKESVESLSKELNEMSSDKEQQFQERQNLLVEICRNITDHIGKFVYEKEKLDDIKTRKEKLEKISKNEKEIARINDLIFRLGGIETSTNIEAIKLRLEAMKSLYINSDFSLIYKSEKLNEIYQMFSSNVIEEHLFNEFLSIKNDNEKIEQKKQYISYQYYLHENKSYVSKVESLKEHIEYGIKLEKYKNDLDSLNQIFLKKIEEHKNAVNQNLKIPLLIFTGKLLQDYQNGLGVFIHEKLMRFVPSGKSGDDILNTFSSGQLSAFVLAFLLVMNSVYSKTKDNVDFLLIDDPVQTMDDINIASFIELLRNNYRDKQIILSTHEVDKEKYMLYKFIKFGIQVDSLNVKDKLYTIIDNVV